MQPDSKVAVRFRRTNGAEQRRTPRVPVRLEVQWSDSPSKFPDVASDLSLGGCYVESLNTVKVGDVLNLKLCLPFNQTLRFRGEVRYHQPTIGFGIKFLQLSPFEQATLQALIKYWAQRAGVARFPQYATRAQ